MSNTTSQTIQTGTGAFEIECRMAPRVVVFSHGFGVRRDSRGMFADIVQALPDHTGYILFDYDKSLENGVRATYAAEQVERLRQVVDWARRQPNIENIGLVAHSRGCLIAALAQIYPLPMVIMLAPPLAQGHARQYFTHKPGVQRRGNDWYVPRSDGTVTIIPEGVFKEFDAVQREQVLLKYADMQPMLAVIAGADAVLGEQDYGRLQTHRNITLATIPGASHDFADGARDMLSQLVQQYVVERL